MGYADQFAGFKADWLNSWQGMADMLGYVGTALTSNAWPAAMQNDAYISREWNPEPFEASFAYLMNGTTPGGNIDIGVYTESGEKIIATGATAQVGANQTQFISIVKTVIPSGVLLLALAADTGGVQFMRPNVTTPSFPAGMLAAYGWAQAAASMPLPGSLPDPLIEATASVIPPMFGLIRRWP